jgi:hypothetical protein
MVRGALWREERHRDVVAWHALHVLAAAGSKRRFTLEEVLGRKPMPLVEERPAPPPPTPEPEPDEPQPVDLIRARLDMLVAAGLAQRMS